MISRKVNLVGSNTLTVSLPLEWTRKLNIKKGDNLTIKLSKDNLIIFPEEDASGRKEFFFDWSESTPYKRRILFGPFVSGYDKVTIRYHSKKTLYFIERNVDLMYGFELNSTSKDLIIMQNVIQPNTNEFENMLNRLIYFSTNMFEDLICLLHGEIELNKVVERMFFLEKSLTRLELLCRRIINSNPTVVEKVGSFYVIIRLIENIGDALLGVVDDIKFKKMSLSEKKEYLEIFIAIKDSYELLMDALLKRDWKSMLSYFDKEDFIYEKMQQIINNKTFKSHRIVISLDRVYNSLHDMSEEIALGK